MIPQSRTVSPYTYCLTQLPSTPFRRSDSASMMKASSRPGKLAKPMAIYKVSESLLLLIESFLKVAGPAASNAPRVGS